MRIQPLLITGTPGRGQWAMAKRIAQSYACMQETKPCGICVDCKLFDEGMHPDLWMQVDDGESISIETARLLNEHMHQKPTRAPCRIVLIEHFDRATVAAQQSLLKCVEEPFVATGIVFTAKHPDRVLPTMRSRMAVHAIKPFSCDAFQAWCVEEGIPYNPWLYELTDASPWVLKHMDIEKVLALKGALENEDDVQRWVEAMPRDVFYATVYHVLAKRAQCSMDEKDFKRLASWQELYREVGPSKSMNWAMQVKGFFYVD